ncbi:hypothetical protein [Haliscomenobacter hydrossis]|nr:hypothetical protein [Haliscomenobacter hydrossis]
MTQEVGFEKDHTLSLGDFLEEKISFSGFGSTVNSIRFIPIIVSPVFEKFYPNEIIYHRSRHQLGLYWQMDYERVMKSTAAECKAYLAEFFIEVLEIAKATKRIRDFDYDGFIAAVKAVLPEWVASEPEI